MKPWTDLPHILIAEFYRTTETFLSWFKSSKLGGFTLIRKTLSISGFPSRSKISNYYLRCSLVAACLETYLRIPSCQNLLLGEVSHILIRHLGTYLGSIVLRVLLSSSTQGEQAENNLDTHLLNNEKYLNYVDFKLNHFSVNWTGSRERWFNVILFSKITKDGYFELSKTRKNPRKCLMYPPPSTFTQN